jgi:hypothetical protein
MKSLSQQKQDLFLNAALRVHAAFIQYPNQLPQITTLRLKLKLVEAKFKTVDPVTFD